MTRSPGLSPLEHLDEIGVLRPSWTWRLVALLPPRSTTKTQLPPVSLKKAPLGISSAADGSPSVSLACTVWPRWIDCGSGPIEHQVDLELAVAHLRIDLRDLEPVGLAVDVGGRRLPDRDPAEIEFVDVGLQLVGAGAVDLADPLALLQRLAELDVEAAQAAR